MYRMVFTRRSTRIPSRIFGSCSRMSFRMRPQKSNRKVTLPCSESLSQSRNERERSKGDGAMGTDGAYIGLGLKVWKAQIERADKLFGSLSSEEVQREIAPGRNRLLYLWGHLTAIHDAMLPLLGLGVRLHAEFDGAFVSNPDKSAAATPSHEQVRQAWHAVNGDLRKGMDGMAWS